MIGSCGGLETSLRLGLGASALLFVVSLIFIPVYLKAVEFANGKPPTVVLRLHITVMTFRLVAV